MSEERSSEDRPGWSTAGGVLAGVAATIAVTQSGIARWLAVALLVVGIYVLIAPLLWWWPWGSRGRTIAILGTVGLVLGVAALSIVDTESVEQPDVHLRIEGTDLTGIVTPYGRFPRLTVAVRMANFGTPTTLHDWSLVASVGKRRWRLDYIPGQTPGKEVNPGLQSAELLVGDKPLRGEIVGLVYFITRELSARWLSYELGLGGASPLRLTLSAHDENGKAWSTSVSIASFGTATAQYPDPENH